MQKYSRKWHKPGAQRTSLATKLHKQNSTKSYENDSALLAKNNKNVLETQYIGVETFQPRRIGQTSQKIR